VAPQGARDGDSDPEYLDWRPGRDWETALARELPRVVDARYRTIPTRRGRAIVGLSAGGYGAMLLGIHNLDVFGAVESWSGYFHPTDPTGRTALDLGSPARNAHASAHAAVPQLKRKLTKQPSFLGFYVGDADDRFRAENVQLDRELTATRIPHVFHVYSGGHSFALWQAEATRWLGLALGHLDAATD
jgi:S-formylglutathione hydrolase FrmB